jgi:hypothetical protein
VTVPLRSCVVVACSARDKASLDIFRLKDDSLEPLTTSEIPLSPHGPLRIVRQWDRRIKNIFNLPELDVTREERLTKEGKNRALSFECLRGWFQSICPSRCFRLPSLLLLRACTPHDAWRRSVYYGTSPFKTQGKPVSSKDDLHLNDSIAQIPDIGSSRCLIPARKWIRTRDGSVPNVSWRR